MPLILAIIVYVSIEIRWSRSIRLMRSFGGP